MMLSWMTAPQMKETDWKNTILGLEDETAELVPRVGDDNIMLGHPHVGDVDTMLVNSRVGDDSILLENPGVGDDDIGMESPNIGDDRNAVENPCVGDVIAAAENHAGEESLEPAVGMEFASEEEAKVFYKAYAKHMGFVVRTSSFYCSKLNGERISREFVCSRQGLRKINETRNVNDTTNGGKKKRKRFTKRTGCTAMITVRKQEASGKWVIVKFRKDHNHPLLGSSEVLTPRPPKTAKSTKNRAREKGKKVRKATTPVPKDDRGQPSNVSLDDNASINKVAKVRRWYFGNETQNILGYFKRRQANDPGFFYAVEVDERQCLSRVFWVDGRSRTAYEHFGDVVTFDTSYRSNRFQVPFAPFIGVNHHLQPISFGCALLGDENISTFVWLFKTWLTAMNERLPVSLITDRDKAVRTAVANVFPEIHHRFCLSQINKKRNAKLPHAVNAHPHFQMDFDRCIHRAETVEEFESCWDALLEKYVLRENEWLKSLYEDRHQWVSVYLRDKFFADMSSEQQCESNHPFFDVRVNEQTSLQDFLMHYERELNDRYEKEAHEDYLPIDTSPTLCTRSAIEKQAANIYTRKVFEIFQEELLEECNYSVNKIDDDGVTSTYRVARFQQEYKGWPVTFNVSERKTNCGCKKFEFSGILCCHILAVFRVANVFTIPSHYILKRWTKNAKSGGDSDKYVIDAQATHHQVMFLRYNILCREALRCVENTTLSLDVFNAAMDALQEAARNTAAAKEIITIVENVGMTINGIHMENASVAHEENVAENQAASHDPKSSKAKGQTPNRKSKSMCSHCKGPKHNIRSCPAKVGIFMLSSHSVPRLKLL